MNAVGESVVIDDQPGATVDQPAETNDDEPTSDND